MKYLVMILLAAAGILLGGCKYEEGPILSLRSREDRVANTWKVVSATDEDGKDVSDEFSSWKFTFSLDSTAQLTYNLGSISANLNGTWELTESDDRLTINLGGLFGTQEYIILRLTEDEFWVRDLEHELEQLKMETF
ncbi:MAG: lipocalin family protein [Bacteroidia bacterium]|nr:lipocalin family protein [Bacteroidia bacterium]